MAKPGRGDNGVQGAIRSLQGLRSTSKSVALTKRKHGTKRAKVLAQALAMSQMSLGNH